MGTAIDLARDAYQKWVQTVTDRVMLFLEEGQAVTDENLRDVERMLT